MPGVAAWQDPQVLLQLEMARQLRKLQRGRHSGSSNSEERSSAEGSDSENGGRGGKLKALLKLRRRAKHRPLRIVLKDRARCLRRLGIYVLSNGKL